MKRITRWIVSLCFGLVCSASLALGLFGVSTSKASANSVVGADNIVMVEGASLRVGDEAIRFQAYVKRSYYDGLVNGETGIYFIPADLVDGELTNETPLAQKVRGWVWSEPESTDTHYVFNYVLQGIPESSYGREILARAYVKEGDTYTWTANPQQRSLAYVASHALEVGVNADGEEYNETELGYLSSYVDSAVKDFEINQDSFNLTAGETQDLSKNMVGTYLDDDVSEYAVKYASDNTAVATVENGEVVAKSAGVATVTATLGTKTDTFTVVVAGENQDILLTAETKSLDVSFPTGYEVTSITCAGYNLGKDPAVLTIPEALETDLENHGENVAQVVATNGETSYTVNIPVTLITSEISDLAGWQSAIQPDTTTEATYGYYVLVQDIDVNTNSLNVLQDVGNVTSTTGGEYGFRGTIDGRGYTLRNTAVWWRRGWFGAIGSGATVKNIVITAEGLFAYGNERYVLGMQVFGATFENVTINLVNLSDNGTGNDIIALAYDGFTNCDITNLTVNVTGAVTSIFGGGANANLGVQNTIFTDCYVILQTADSSVTRLGNCGTTVYVAQNGSTANGETQLAGIQQFTKVESAVTLATHDVVVGEATSLDLGEYADYTIESITYDGTSLGTDPSSVVINQADKSKHGAGTSITVVATKVEKTVTITIPVVLITDVITTADEFIAIMPAGQSAVTYGYYVLAKDIGSADTVIGANGRAYYSGVTGLNGTNYGFKGTIDGRGYEFTFQNQATANTFGLFAHIGTGAVIKDITLTTTSVQPQWGTYMLAKAIEGAEFENVTINVNSATTSAGYAIFAQKIVDTTFTNVDIVIGNTTNAYGVLFTHTSESSNGVTFTGEFTGNEFVDTAVYLLGNAKLASLAKNGTTVYTAEGLDVSGAEVLTGITVSVPTVEQAELQFNQTINLESTNYAIDLGEYADYDVTSIKLGTYDLGTSVSSLVISDTLKADTKYHGVQEIVVTVDKGLAGTAVSVPVTIITSVINTVDEFKAIMPTSASSVTYGYYVLGNDIGDETTVIGADGRTIGRNLSTVSAELGFRGTIDGRGYTFTFGFGIQDLNSGTTTDMYGLFGFMGTGATVKNINFVCCNSKVDTGSHLLGQNVQGTTFDNVTFEFKTIYSRYTGGLLAPSITNSTFTDVDIYISETVVSATNYVFAGAVNQWDGTSAFSGNTFENVNVYTLPLVTLGGLAIDGTTVYGNEDVKGITVSTPDPEQVALDYNQEIYLEADTYAIEIGEYADYGVLSIKLGTYDLGTDISALTFPDGLKNDKSLHGEQNIVVTIDKGFADTEVIVPVTIITAIINDASEFMSCMPTSATATYGYYVLGNDIVAETAIGTTNYINRWFDSTLSGVADNTGFMGTIDGRGHSFTYSVATGANQYGVFGLIGTGAMIKDITFNVESFSVAAGTFIFAKRIAGATFTDVTVKLESVTVGSWYFGILSAVVKDTTFNNVEFILKETSSTSTAVYLVAGTNNATYDPAPAFSNNTFTNTTLYLHNTPNIKAGKDGASSKEYTFADCGINVVNVALREDALSTRQDVFLSSADNSLDLGAYNDYEVTSITYTSAGGTVYDLGTNPSKLTIDDTLKSDLQNHGEQNIVVLASTDKDIVQLTVPVTIITYAITSLDEWEDLLMPTSDTGTTYGYYILANDIISNRNIQPTFTSKESTVGEYGFRGTLDGKGYEVTISPWTQNGLFGAIGTGALVKNITISSTGLNLDTNRYVLGRVGINASLENIVFNLTDLVDYRGLGTTTGALMYSGFRNCTFTNVTVNVTGHVYSVFGGNASQDWGLNVPGYECTFDNCSIYLKTAESSIDEIGHCLDTIYVAQGMATPEGESVVQGITLYDSTNTVWLFQDGKSTFTLVKPKNSTAYINSAAEEFVTLFEKATGVTLSVITDATLAGHDENVTYISLGNTNLYKTAGLTVPMLKDDGYYLKTLDNTIYIVGGTDEGVLNGVYGFMDQIFDFEAYHKDCYTLNTKATALKLPALDVSDNPAFAMRSQAGQLLLDNGNHYADRLYSTDYYWANLLPIISAEDSTKTDQGHNSLYYLPKSLYYSTYPEFYSTNSTWNETAWGVEAQLCYTAQGNSVSYNKMVQLCAERIETSLVKYTPASYPNYNSVMLGIQDNYLMCTCDACNSVVSQYGSISATIIIFLNDVAKLVDAWMESNPAYARDLQYMFYAYQGTLETPTTMPTVETKIAPFVAISEMNHSKSATDTTANSQSSGGFTYTNAQVLAFMKTWGNFATSNGGGAWTWMYGNFFRDYFCFYDWTALYSTIFPYLQEYGYEFVYVQQQSRQNGAFSAFMTLNAYVSAKLMWDPSLSLDDLVSEYMSAMYLDASDEMTAIFNQWKSLFSSNSMGNLSLGYENPGKKLTYKQVDNLLTLFDNAYSAISGYATTDPELYATLKARIDMEWLSPAKLAIVEFKNYFNGSYFWYSTSHDYSTIAEQFKQIVSDLGITYASEFNTIDTITDSL